MITTVGFVTADRPAALRRALESFARHCTTHDRRPRFLIVDGSRKPSNRRATQSVVAAVGRATGHDLQYAGDPEATGLRAPLKAAGVPASSFAAGATRNLVLLLTAGERILTVDDDVVCNVWALPGRHDDVAVTGHRELRKFAHFPTRAAALAATRPSPANLLAEHEALLGRELRAVMARSRSPADLTHACPHVLAALRTRRRQIVKATFSGFAGDSGTQWPERALLGSGAVRDLLWSNRREFNTAMTSREVHRIATKRIVTHDCHCRAFCTGLVNQTCLPPFPPIGRNEDGVFGALLAVCDPATLFGHVPAGVVHNSDRPSRFTGKRMPSASETRLSELVINLLFRHASSIAATSPIDRMHEIGELLIGVGSMNPRAFVTLVTELSFDARSGEFARAQRAAAVSACPDYWSAALTRYHAQYLKATRRPGFFLPIEFHGRRSIGAGYRAAQTFLNDFGQLVASWPALWDAARAQNAARASR